MSKYIRNSKLETLETPFEWRGTPIDKKGRFINEEVPFVNSFRNLLKWKTMRNPQKLEKKHDHWRLPIDYDSGFLTSTEDCIVWLGHSSFFIRIDRITILIDPVFYNVSFLKRKSAFPIEPEMLRGIDYVLISHDHRDHCDARSLKLLSQNNPNATYLTGLGMDGLVKKITQSNKIQAAGWYQKYNTPGDLTIYFTPSQHWGRRTINDMNCRLWGAFVIKGVEKTIYFSGDSGYGKHFLDLAKVFPKIDYAIIGIGAYKPLFFMSPIHLSPSDAIQAFKDLGAREMIPMHYGTFDLTDEPLSDPIETLNKLDMDQKLYGKVDYLLPGEKLVIKKEINATI